MWELVWKTGLQVFVKRVVPALLNGNRGCFRHLDTSLSKILLSMWLILNSSTFVLSVKSKWLLRWSTCASWWGGCRQRCEWWSPAGCCRAETATSAAPRCPSAGSATTAAGGSVSSAGIVTAADQPASTSPMPNPPTTGTWRLHWTLSGLQLG